MNKLAELKRRLGLTDTSEDIYLSSLLDSTKNEILEYRYSLVGIPKEVTDVPREFVNTQLEACVLAYNLMGVEGQTDHNENGINRSYRFSDVTSYIRSSVFPLVGFGSPHLYVQEYVQVHEDGSVVLEVYNRNGELNAFTSDSTVATVTKGDDKVTISGVSEGECVVSVVDSKNICNVEVNVL